MRIIDYQTNRGMNDVGIFLSQEEAEELIIYLHKLVQKPVLGKVHLSEIISNRLERELTIVLEDKDAPISLAA
jgi:hypothetical protein